MVEFKEIKKNFVVFSDNEKNCFYFSYQTLIAFEVESNLFVIENLWGFTTGKHLNMISDKKKRLKKDIFLKKYQELFNVKLDSEKYI